MALAIAPGGRGFAPTLKAGLTTIQVHTGKFASTDREHPSIRPDHLIGSAADLPSLLLKRQI